MALKIYQELKKEKKDTNVYLKFTKEGKEILVDSVTADGEWIKSLCGFSSKGIQLYESAENAGFPVDGVDKIILVD